MKPMITMPALESLEGESPSAERHPVWVSRAALLWSHRSLLVRTTLVAMAAAVVISLVIPKQYKSQARIMPPDHGSSGAMILAALASHSTGLEALSGLAGGLLGGHTTTALFVDLLRSGTVSGDLIDRFDLMHVYHKKYRIDAGKRLAKQTKVSDDKKSGVITIEVEDTSPTRARDLTQAYLDELNKLVTSTNTSAAHQERIFVEQRLHSVEHDLEAAQIQFSDYSSRNTTVDMKEQTRAMVDVGARIQGQLLVEESGLQALKQIYGDSNVRVRESEARIAALKRQVQQMVGSAEPSDAGQSGDTASGDAQGGGQLYPKLREVPRLAVPYADLYRKVKVQETVYELLTQQYEIARIEEAKDVPVVSVIDRPGVAERKSFPPRTLIVLLMTGFSIVGASVFVIVRDSWQRLESSDPLKVLGTEIVSVMRDGVARVLWRGRREKGELA